MIQYFNNERSSNHPLLNQDDVPEIASIFKLSWIQNWPSNYPIY
jgi:hypothetical protein